MQRAILCPEIQTDKVHQYYWAPFPCKYLSEKTIIFWKRGLEDKDPRETCVAPAEKQKQHETCPVLRTQGAFRVFSQLLLWALFEHLPVVL